MLAQRLGRMPESAAADKSERQLCLSMCVYDPVPGNLINTVRNLDWFGLSTASMVMDVGVSQDVLDNVLALYPFEPLPDFAFHAPVLSRYPPACTAELDATLGCHQGAVYPPERVPSSMRDACLLSRHRILSFLNECGVRIHAADTLNLARVCLTICERELHTRLASRRYAHTPGGIGYILRAEQGLLLNRHHLHLLKELAPDDPRISECQHDDSHFMLQVLVPTQQKMTLFC